MEYRRLGQSGLQLSAFSFGAWVTFGAQLDHGAVRELLAIAWDAGVNFFDNAEGYANGQAEGLMGRAIHALGWPRDRWCVSSKVFFGAAERPTPLQKGLSRKHVFEACHAALKRLQVDYLDLYFCHRPDPEVPISEIVWTMHQLILAGKVLYWGTSEWPATLIREAAAFAQAHHLIGPTMEQPQYNLLARERVEHEYAPLYRELGLGTTVWSPLASGVLSGKYLGGQLPPGSRLALPQLGWLREMHQGAAAAKREAIVSKLDALARQAGVPLAQVALAWCLQNPDVSTVILGATQPEQLKQNLAALPLRKLLGADFWRAIERATVVA